MGIFSFESFLKLYDSKIMQPVCLRNQYVVLDGNEIMCKLYVDCDTSGRGNYVRYQSIIETFFENLKACGITPVVLLDGFEIIGNKEKYFLRKQKKIGCMVGMFEGRKNSHILVKPCLCDIVFAQVLAKLEIISVTGIGNMDETMVTVANLLEAPLVAGDTNFCTFRLNNGVVPLHMFYWKMTQDNEAGQPCIMGRAFYQQRLANYFRMDENAIPFLMMFYSKVSWIEPQTFQDFKEKNLKDVALPEHLLHITRKSNNNVKIEKALVWLAGNYKYDEEESFIQQIVDSLPEEKQKKMKSDILSCLESRRNPRSQQKVLDIIRNRVDDPLLAGSFENVEIQQDEQVDALVQENGLQELVEDMSSLSFPSWALHLLFAQATGEEVINYLPLALTDPQVYPSANKATEIIRLRSYQALVLNYDDTKVFVEFDMIEKQYGESARHLVAANNVELRPHGRAFERVDDEATMERRRQYLLDSLMPQGSDARAKYDAVLVDLSDDLKLPVAATFYWIAQARPDISAIKALAFQLVICHGLESIRQLDGVLCELRKSLNTSVRGHWCLDSQALHWSSEWQLCLWEAIKLNQILDFPLPEPEVAKVFEGILFERACACFLCGHSPESYIRREKDRNLFRILDPLFVN